MNKYTVVDLNRRNRLIALRGLDGRYHAAHCTSDMPEIGDVLSGSLPEQGFSLLIASDGAVNRVTFRGIYMTQQWARDLVQSPSA
jgi:hypothetical protein